MAKSFHEHKKALAEAVDCAVTATPFAGLALTWGGWLHSRPHTLLLFIEWPNRDISLSEAQKHLDSMNIMAMGRKYRIEIDTQHVPSSKRPFLTCTVSREKSA
ncbi:hypothetical protein ONE63_003382 [Megalurothrips usitatus]|uniref:Uncharacterized protein n=1 Tax=Megalurothrips usitatus TaxID=439358 RepID=A0AAV7XAU6_9NEOP|nr:hypothetical protein ONE63_003382 [Megalurothrips usitatus]